MARGPCTFKQSDATRAMKAALAAGLEVVRVEIDKAGKIVIETQEKARAKRDTSWDGV